MNTIAVKVVAKVQEAEDIFSYELASADRTPLPPFSAGSHIDVMIRPGLVRQYSLCNNPAESHRYLIGVLRDPASRGGSQAMHDEVQQGDVIEISMPRNHFPLVQARRTLLLAGGIGVTPILCMAERLARIGADFAMHYCARSPGRTAFRQRIAASAFADRVQLHFDSGDEAQKLKLPELLAHPEAGTHIYVCGPGGFIDHVVNTAREKGWPADQVHLEYFGAAAANTDGDTSFEVKIASTGKCYTIPADRTVAQALEACGIDIPLSCEQGVCGTCITRVLEGIPDHRDVYFTDAEHAKNDQFTPCCSRAKGKLLVLDL
ncbi:MULTISPECIES: PDR/VanB family oxidoreductase [unclassified Herbaspirillum]|uniref:PDR/VanB family oxidoreductase n=1 Tax=unclassified Herbaspirillum TaxID=2624150 RepID=UPI00114F6BCF|nr:MULTISPECIES: PDR/VanB family oxidoreductase [unclassified Herbaspirillum]MBB5393788.1 vanillate O-demethylase ferredoxin subunit [Herbaspirillum sp. SJZ102]TQK01352.1 vanillate O-demethylase ferredoxin subunit [Herbaspirillum sp. SJZ130]TQK05748.1 vanillate O-demethylase ferredoxin subunit [Herbaspirillum sp. SJZ106]